MERCDVLVIGAGLLGCFTARALGAWRLRTVVLEAREDVCTGVSRANTGIVYTGYDTKPGTLKTQMCLRANREFGALCRTLGVRFVRCGSLMLARGPRGEGVLRDKLVQGRRNGVPGLELLTPGEVYALEPALGPGVTLGLLAPGTGAVNPWELGLAAFENARDNGAEFRFQRELRALRREAGGFRAETDTESWFARAVVNCAGLAADRVRELCETPLYRIIPTAADYMLLDDSVAGMFSRVLFHEPEEKGKGLTLVPTVDGNLLAGPTELPAEGRAPWATSAGGLERLAALCREVVPALPLGETIRGFASLRPNPFAVERKNGDWVPVRRSISGFTVLEEQGLVSLLGIKTPGLTCAAELGGLAAARAVHWLGGAESNPENNPRRPAPVRLHGMEESCRGALVRENPAYGQIVCRCRDVSLGEVQDAICRGAATLDGVKRRTGTATGRCQGARCLRRVLAALKAAGGVPGAEIQKDGPGSPVLGGGDESL